MKKLMHFSSSGIREHEQSDLHRQSRERRVIARNILDKGDVVGQMHCVNMHQQTEKNLSILIQAFWYILTQEMALMKFKSLIQFLQRVECSGVSRGGLGGAQPPLPRAEPPLREFLTIILIMNTGVARPWGRGVGV
jgi:hypothetical protein